MTEPKNSKEGSKVKTVKQPKNGPFNVLGKFTSARRPEKIYTVKEHLDVPADTGKRISCDCPGWRFSLNKRGYYGCKHTDYVANGAKGDAYEKVEKSVISRTVKSSRVNNDSIKHILAKAFLNAGVHIEDNSFNNLSRHLVKLLANEDISEMISREVIERTETVNSDDDIIRVITLD